MPLAGVRERGRCPMSDELRDQLAVALGWMIYHTPDGKDGWWTRKVPHGEERMNLNTHPVPALDSLESLLKANAGGRQKPLDTPPATR